MEFGTATDDIDGTNVKYNIYYELTSSWNDQDWSSNTAIPDVTPTSGTGYSNAYTITGLQNQNDVEYTFSVRTEDQSANEDNNTITAFAIPTPP